MSDVDKPAAPAGGAAEESDEDDGPEVTDSAEALAEAVSQIQHALRQGEHIYITNYRRSGQKFLNLLALRPVYDSNALLRLCVGIQCELKS
ncbi:hypothetical protein T492DRAFT_855499 [Pavlovales sp. CCMP2436]|nr:hypothetical protein T492DRAFT_855499 [Pavlovales sp. CCMP2436]